MGKTKNIIMVAVVIIILLSLGAYSLTGNHVNNSSLYDDFAKCISDRGMVLYGAYTCGHCNHQKDAFGDSFQYVNYVECDPRGENGNPELCLAAGIGAYPTWIFNDKHYLGFQSFERLSEISGCPLPDS